MVWILKRELSCLFLIRKLAISSSNCRGVRNIHISTLANRNQEILRIQEAARIELAARTQAGI